MNLPPGFDPDPEEWLFYYSFGPAEAVDSYLLAMQVLVSECSLDDEEILEAIPALDARDLAELHLPNCPDHPSPREYFLACEAVKQLMNRIDEQFPDSDSRLLVLRLLYDAIQAIMREVRR